MIIVNDCDQFALHKFKCALCTGTDDYQMLRDASGMGELLSRGRGTCMGYLNNRFMVMLMIFMMYGLTMITCPYDVDYNVENFREKTLEALDDDGWLHTGDLVREDEEGFFTVVGR